MKKGFSLVELIVSVGLISIIFTFSFIAIKNTNTTYADPYEDLRIIISDATNLFLNTNAGIDYKNKLYEKGSVNLNSSILINEGLLIEEYYVKNIKDNISVENLEIIVTLDNEGFLNYSINIV